MQSHTLPRISRSLLSGISALLSLFLASPELTRACDSPVCLAEAADLVLILPSGSETHTAVASGDWSATSTWQDGIIPPAGAKVLIPDGVDVRYDLNSDVRLDTVRVDGALRFANDRNTKIVLDTLFAPTKTAVLEIGTPTAPIPAQFSAKILITGDRRDANGNTAFAPGDTKQFGRGVVSKGKVTMHGAKKDSYLELAGDARIGDTFLTFKQIPSGWQIGDILVLAGTGSSPLDPVYPRPPFSLEFDWFSRVLANQALDTERLKITGIEGNKVYFEHQDVTTGDRTRLRFNHLRPTGVTKPVGVTADFAIHVGNLSRNIEISSESGNNLSGRDISNAGNLVGEEPFINGNLGSVTQDPTNPKRTIVVKGNVRYVIDFTERINEIWKRGHAMFMHNSDVDIAYVAFWHLGRTDKNRDLDEVGVQLDKKIGNGTNQRGRYGVHFHRTGTLDWMGVPSHIQGCAIWGSPGWGIAHHDANLTVEDNVIYEVLGTAIMQESGAEIGTWRRNLAMKTYGGAPFISPMQGSVGSAFYDRGSNRLENFDYGYEGVGFWLHGAGQIAGEDNISAGAVNAGFASFGNGDSGLKNRLVANIETRLLPSSQRDVARNLADGSLVEVSAIPIRQLKRLVAYNTTHIVHVWGHTRREGDALYFNVTVNDTTWVPAHPYFSVVEDFLGWELRGNGIRVEYSGNYHFRDGIAVVSPSDNRRSAIKMNGNSSDFENVVFVGYTDATYVPHDISPAYNRNFRGSEFRNVTFKSSVRLPFNKYVTGDFGAYSRVINTTFDAPASPIAAPVPAFTPTAVGGLAVKLDASASASADSADASATSKGIWSYGWDLNNDGKIDEFGRIFYHYFPAAGSYTVTLKVWDKYGATASIPQTFDVSLTDYTNAFTNGDFANPAAINNTSNYNSFSSHSVWHVYGNLDEGKAPNAEGVLKIAGGTFGGAAQFVNDNRMRRGTQTFGFRARTTGGDGTRFRVRLYGIKGEFENNNLAFGEDPSRTDGWPVRAGAFPYEATLLVDKNLAGNVADGATSTWKNFSFNVDLGTGFDRIVVQSSAYQSLSGSAAFEIDDVSLVGPGTAVALPPALNLPPDVTLDLPARAAPRLTMVADVRDPDGTIAKVEFFDGATKIGEDTTAPFQWTLFNAASGMHEYTARVTDNLGAQATSPERYTQVIVDGIAAPPAVNPPAAPTGLVATVISGSRINLSWTDASINENGFELERRLMPAGAFAFVAFLPPGSTAYSDTGLPAGTAYTYRVRAVNDTDPSAYSGETPDARTWATVDTPTFGVAPGIYENTQSVTLATTTAGATIRYTTDGSTPTSTTGTVYSGPISLAASATLKAIAYKIQMTDSPVASGTYTIAEPVWEGLLYDNNIGYQDGTLESALKASGFTVLAYDNPPATSPARPTWWNANATYTQVSGNRTTYDFMTGIRWNGVNRTPLTGAGDGSSGVGKLTIQPNVTSNKNKRMAVILTSYQNSATARVTSIKTGSVTSNLNQPLTVGSGKTTVGVFTLRVRPGEPIEITITYTNVQWFGLTLAFEDGDGGGSTIPAAPSALVATSASPSQVNLSWTDNSSNETGFKIERKTGASGTYAQIGTTVFGTNTYPDSGLSASTTYFYRVRATNLAGDSTFSAETSVTTGAPVVITGTPSTLFGTAAAQGGISADNNYELGTRFRTGTAGYVTALRVWRPINNASFNNATVSSPSSYTARLWTSSGTKLAQVTIAAPTAGAWAEATLDSPVALTAGTTYVVSYSVASGQAYQAYNPATQVSVVSGPLSTLSDGKIGVYTVSSSGAFPTSTYQNSNYYADVRFVVPDPLTPYQTWQEDHFTEAQIANSSFSGMTADPDGDGLVNMLEYALDLDPLAAASTAATTVGTESGTGRLTLTFRRARPASELTYIVECSSDMVTWRTLVTNPLGDAAVGDLITVSDAPLNTEDQTSRFLRLKVQVP